jgi:hypothetical protein
MKEKNKQRKKVYRSVEEFEEEFFPTAHEKKLAEKRSKEPSTFGTGLATELLESIRQQLMK